MCLGATFMREYGFSVHDLNPNVVNNDSSERFLSLDEVLPGDFEGDLQYHEVPRVEALSDPAKVGPVFKGDVPPIEAGVRAACPVRGSCVASGQVVSRRRYTDVDFAIKEDISGSTIGRRLHRKCNIDPLLAKSPNVIEIADGDNQQTMEMAGLHWLGEPGVASTRLVPPWFQVMPRRRWVLFLWVPLVCISRGGALRPVPFY
uniref:Uncharacterized protein n=1 Tax=Lactuca sativa TaxID=4236 RepID=A0A9R1UEL6_LACSA|nr:hypothetical protein LSAT_V11C900504210 [Lactuca sativa]